MKLKQAQWCKAYYALVRDPALSAGARLTLVLLRSYCGTNKDSCWPSTERLCANLGCDRKALFRYLNELEKHGCLRRKKRRLNNSFTSTKYILLDERKAITKAAFPCSQNGHSDRLGLEAEHKYTTAKKLRLKNKPLPCSQNGDAI